ncbi:MAG: ABC transporter permease [Candidatus Hydrogenedentota bacterium]
MLFYLIKKSIIFFILIFLISFITFFFLSMMPGDPVEMLITSNPKVKPEDIIRLKKQWGLDQPMPVRYLKWLKQTLKGDLGFSITYKESNLKIITSRIKNTFFLLIGAFLISLLLSIPVGIIAALRQYSYFDYTINFFVFIGISIPSFWLGIMAILIFSVYLQWFPAGGMPRSDSFLEYLRYLFLPVCVLSIESIAGWSRYTRSGMLEVLREDYIRTARAKGLPEHLVILKHAFRNTLIPILTLLMLSIPGLFSGALITETVFSWPGMGRLLYESVLGGDSCLACNCFMFLSILTVIFNMVADLMYAMVDPRVRIAGG